MLKKNSWAILGVTLVMGVAQRGSAEPKDLYLKNCKNCHAEDGSGKKSDGSSLSVVKTLKIKDEKGLDILSEDAKKLTLDEVVKVITDGKDGTDKGRGKMKAAEPSKMSADDIKAIAKYVKEVLQAKAK